MEYNKAMVDLHMKHSGAYVVRFLEKSKWTITVFGENKEMLVKIGPIKFQRQPAEIGWRLLMKDACVSQVESSGVATTFEVESGKIKAHGKIGVEVLFFTDPELVAGDIVTLVHFLLRFS